MFQFYLNAAIKGVIEGVTEFLPISSTGHLILVRDWLPLTPDLAHAKELNDVFDVIIQLPAIFAVLVLYRSRLWSSLISVPSQTRSRNFWIGLVVAFMPAGVVGYLIHDKIEEHLMFAVPVACALIVGGVILILADRFMDEGKYTTAEDVPLPTAFFIGVFQCFGMVPGTSRSGATIIGARLLHLTRSAAAEYSFFLAIPTMFGAFAFKMFKSWKLIRADDAAVLVIGSLVSFVIAMIVVRWLIVYLKKHSLAAFGWYRLVLGAATLAYVFGTK